MEAISIISNKTVYTISLIEKETGSNYNMFAQLYKKGEKMPLAGTCFSSYLCIPYCKLLHHGDKKTGNYQEINQERINRFPDYVKNCIGTNV